MFHSPIFWLFLFCLAGPQAVRTEPYNSTSSLTTSPDDVTADLLVLASEETPTRAPRPVTKQGNAKKVVKVQKAEKKDEEADDVEDVTPSEDPLYVTDCSEPLNKDISCSVNIVGCSDNVFKYVEQGQEPPRAHDVRIAPTTKVMGANRIDKRKHRLHVDVSWQIPQLDSSSNLKAFKLIVNGPDGRNTCFVFNVTQQPHKDEDNVAPRYRFSSNTLFEFGHAYSVTIVSLPISRKRSPKVSATSQMPDDPDEAPTKLVKTHEEICSGKSNPQASKWAASYRKIFLFSAIRMIQIEFLAAPPQYCFEEYEVRLLDSSGIVMLQSAVISKDDLKTEIIDGRAVQFGEYNFTDIELDTNLIPSVIPIETAHDGRCLCETENGCSCLAADWKPVKLSKIEKPPPGTNDTVVSDEKTGKEKSVAGTWHWHQYAIAAAIIIASIFALMVLFGVRCYRKFNKTKKAASNVHLMNENPAFSHSGSIPLILKQSVSVLILYSHDSSQHEAAVLAFAELLRDVFHLNVHLDAWDEDDIDENRFEYLNSSIVRSDKVILINSIGAYYRTVFRYKREPALERIVRGRNDGLFNTQCELALQHPCIISCHFNYTNPKYVLFPVKRLLQYSIPENIMTLASSLTGQPARAEQLAGFNQVFARLQAAVSRKAHYIESDPQWFEHTHHRVEDQVPVEEEDPVDLIPLPPSLRVRVENEEVFEQLDTMPMDELEQKLKKKNLTEALELKEEPYSASVDVEPEERPEKLALLEDPKQESDEDVEEEDDVDSVEDISPTARIEELQRLIVHKDINHDSGNLDSAYVSGSDFSTDVHTDIIDKPRLNSEVDRRKAAREDSAFHDDVIGVH
ncbi:hypothetical protein GCK72_013032 [Caenorhabditis remanei]|uniref:SEFIR domain-containing protein n=1 Tax=Caenorhabditis remanei TaxID=31234 RepID=A0A6A5GQ30_CAERE|nr:hypothetical protein GCK72_013032 [Caenorhabditis remanei]KAF1756579.1 hypothetical protein GCK72_013032 [Caenorhabditis remanei]